MEFCIPIKNSLYLPLIADVVDADIPLLIGLDYLDKENLLADNLSNKLNCEDKTWELPIKRIKGHVFVQWNLNTILFIKIELCKLHRQIHHLSPP